MTLLISISGVWLVLQLPARILVGRFLKVLRAEIERASEELVR